MKLFGNLRVSLVLIGFAAIFLVGGGRAKADFICGSSALILNVNGTNDHVMPSLSADGLSLYISSIRAGLGGIHDLWVATRSSTTEDFGIPLTWVHPRVTKTPNIANGPAVCGAAGPLPMI